MLSKHKINIRLFILLLVINSFSFALIGAPHKPCVVVLELGGGVRVEFINGPEGPSMRHYRVVEASKALTPWSIRRYIQEKVSNLWSFARTTEADKQVSLAYKNLNDKDVTHQQLAYAMRKALTVRGIESEVVYSSISGFQVRFLANKGASFETSWLVEVSRFLETSSGKDGKPVGLMFDTKLASLQRDALVIGPDGETFLGIGTKPHAYTRSYQPTPGDVHELFHWMQDQLRIANNPQAWPAHYIKSSQKAHLFAEPSASQPNPFSSWTVQKLEDNYREDTGFILEEVATYGLQAILAREILEGIITVLPDQKSIISNELVYLAIEAVNSHEIHFVFADAAEKTYAKILQILKDRSGDLSLTVINENEIEVSAPDGRSVTIEEFEESKIVKQGKVERWDLLQAELERGRQALINEKLRLVDELAKTKLVVAPIFSIRGTQSTNFKKKDGSPIAFAELASWARQ